MASAFNSAGQRCSALRVLFLQQEIAPRVMEMLSGAMDELRIGNPCTSAATSAPSSTSLQELHCNNTATDGQRGASDQGDAATPRERTRNYFAPRVYEIEKLSQLQHEVFGPILHIIQYQASRLKEVVEAINNSGYA